MENWKVVLDAYLQCFLSFLFCFKLFEYMHFPTVSAERGFLLGCS